MDYENIRVETRGRVALVTLHRPAALNALFIARRVFSARDGAQP